MLNWTILTVIAIIGVSLLADNGSAPRPQTTIASAAATQVAPAQTSLP